MSSTRGPIVGSTPPVAHAHRIGGWLPNDVGLIHDHVKEMLKRAKATKHEIPMADPVKALQDLISNNPVVYMLFNQMLTEVPTVYPYDQDPRKNGHYEITTVENLLTTINYQINTTIAYDDSVQIGTPINAILTWPMATKAGFAAFIRNDVNQIFQQILQFWGQNLKQDTSIDTVTTADGGWLSVQAQNDSSSPGLANFLKTYVVPDQDDHIHYGFSSWDQFFTRKFIPGLRPIASEGDDSVIVSAAESTPFCMQTNVQLHDTFWLKNSDGRSNYSLAEMLGDVALAQQFVGGTVYQAFLSADSYHNWHAPVSGTYVAEPKIIPGTYYSEPIMWGFDQDDDNHLLPDASADAYSQGYISSVAVRGVAVIQADNDAIGQMAMVMIGMAEVSSIEFDYPKNNPSRKIQKGEELGRFHFGGSTHCLIFGPNVKLAWDPQAKPMANVQMEGKPVKVNSILATVGS
jgi:phosphatidylserine decarboxylase